MTVEGLFASVVWSGVVGFGLSRADRIAQAVCRSWERVATIRGASDVEVARMRTESPSLDRSASPTKSSEIQLPDDLVAHAMQWGDEWARDDERDNLRRLYLEHHTGDASETWQKVRRAVGIGELP